MELFRIINNRLDSVERETFKLEKDIQSLVEGNLEAVFNLQFVSSEFKIGEFRIDTVAFDEEKNAFVLIEYKRGSNYSVVDQGYSYLSAMVNNKAEFILEYNEKLDQPLKRSEIDWSSSKVIFVSPAFSRYQRNSINFSDVPFELWEIRKFEKGLVAFEQIESNSNESIDKVIKKDDHSVMSAVSSEVSRNYTEADHVKKLSQGMMDLWSLLKERLESLSDTSLYAEKNYLALKSRKTNVCYIKFRKDGIRILISRGWTNSDGVKSRRFFTIDDPKRFAKEYSSKRKTGRESHDYKFYLSNNGQVDYAMFLIDQKHKSLS